MNSNSNLRRGKGGPAPKIRRNKSIENRNWNSPLECFPRGAKFPTPSLSSVSYDDEIEVPVNRIWGQHSEYNVLQYRVRALLWYCESVVQYCTSVTPCPSNCEAPTSILNLLCVCVCVCVCVCYGVWLLWGTAYWRIKYIHARSMLVNKRSLDDRDLSLCESVAQYWSTPVLYTSVLGVQ